MDLSESYNNCKQTLGEFDKSFAKFMNEVLQIKSGNTKKKNCLVTIV